MYDSFQGKEMVCRKKQEFPLKIQIEINDLSNGWEIGSTQTFKCKMDISKNNYGYKAFAYPLRDEDAEKAKEEILVKQQKDIAERYLEYIADNISKGYW